MKMKRYFAVDSRHALRELRDDQGPDAVILSNRRVNGGVEIIAAMDYEDAMVDTSLGNSKTLSDKASFSLFNDDINHLNNSKNQPSVIGDNLQRSTDEGSSELKKIKDELKGLRTIMEAPLMQIAWGETDRVQPLFASLLKQLMTLGLSATLSKKLTKRVASQGLNKHAWLEALKLLANQIPVNDEDILENGGVVSLIGPTGVGKTTTIAKLAARFALKHGRRGITLITTDNYRIGAHEQLRTYGRILGVPVHVATDSSELTALLRESKANSTSKKLTLIDTAGICQKDSRLTEQLATFNVTDMNIKNYLVLSATGQLNLQDDVICAFSKVNLAGCVITKIDEASSLGEIMSVLIQHELPIHFVCNGQKVPDDIYQARGKLLVKEAVNLMRHSKKSLSTEELAYSFGGMVNNAII
ncbi:MAG: flagellar biosynthesis protein FlhF [Gammaproteobacteria bacterium]|nr:MAG: flagellar biosynthesis protein FlhF [Gammaproteobacteria bacterium]